MATAVGIDLGTTNSVVGVYEGGEPRVVPNAEGSRVIERTIWRTLEPLLGAPGAAGERSTR